MPNFTTSANNDRKTMMVMTIMMGS